MSAAGITFIVAHAKLAVFEQFISCRFVNERRVRFQPSESTECQTDKNERTVSSVSQTQHAIAAKTQHRASGSENPSHETY